MSEDRFLVRCPVFVLGVPTGEAETPREFVRCLAKMSSNEHGLFLAIFTDEDLANRFRVAASSEQLSGIPLSSNELRAVLEELDGCGVKYVAFDVVYDVGHLRGQFAPLREILEDVRRIGEAADIQTPEML